MKAPAMRITAKLHGTLRKYLAADSATATAVDVPDGACVADVLSHLNIPPGHAKMIVCGSEHLTPESVLHDGQELDLFPPLAGGA
jgi:molybdopterin converting factor small subunit